MKTPDCTEYIGETWTIKREAGKVYVNNPDYPSAPGFHVPDYVLRWARRMLKP